MTDSKNEETRIIVQSGEAVTSTPSGHTEADFARAQFAKHPDGHVAMRTLSHAVNAPANDGAWHREWGGMCQDRDMPGFGYEPVSENPMGTQSDETLHVNSLSKAELDLLLNRGQSHRSTAEESSRRAATHSIHDLGLRPSSVKEEATALRAEADKMNACANDTNLVVLSRIESIFYQEVRLGYLNAEKALRDAAERIERGDRS